MEWQLWRVLSLNNAFQVVFQNLYLEGLSCHAAHLAESTSACCGTVCTAASLAALFQQPFQGFHAQRLEGCVILRCEQE